MSVKFDQRENIKAMLPEGKAQDLVDQVGNAITKGQGPRGYLEVLYSLCAIAIHG